MKGKMDTKSKQTLMKIAGGNLPKNLPPPLQNAVIKTREKYGSAQQFAITFNPSIQKLVSANIERAYLGDAPTLTTISKAYNDEILISWLKIQLEDLNSFCGSTIKMEDSQLSNLANIIYREYYYLKATEIHLFLYRFKAGYYAKLYASVDPLAITKSLREFVSERSRDISRIENERKTREREIRDRIRNNEAVSYDEFLKLKSDGKNRETNP